MDKKPKATPREQSAQEQFPRKIGYVAHRLGDLKTSPTSKPETKQTPFVITDWASI